MHSLMKKFPPLESKNLNLIIALKLKRVDLIWSMYMMQKFKMCLMTAGNLLCANSLPVLYL